MKIFTLTLLLTLTLTKNQDLVDIYVYKSSKETENHYIMFDNIDNELQGFYFGTEDGNGHGVFFYAAEMDNLKIDKDGNIEFEIGDRKLFETTQFKIIKREDQKDKPIGHSRGVLKYRGQIIKDRIELICESEHQDCWTNKMTFEKLSNGG